MSGTKALVDSVILIDHLNGVEVATEFLDQPSDTLFLPPVTRAEVLAGVLDDDQRTRTCRSAQRANTLPWGTRHRYRRERLRSPGTWPERTVSTLPPTLGSLFWNVDFERLDVERDATHVLTRILEYGGIDQVRWAIATYGLTRIHSFLKTSGSPELTERTLHFWRCVLNAKEEEWASPPDWRKSSSAPWID